MTFWTLVRLVIARQHLSSSFRPCIAKYKATRVGRPLDVRAVSKCTDQHLVKHLSHPRLHRSIDRPPRRLACRLITSSRSGPSRLSCLAARSRPLQAAPPYPSTSTCARDGLVSTRPAVPGTPLRSTRVAAAARRARAHAPASPKPAQQSWSLLPRAMHGVGSGQRG